MKHVCSLDDEWLLFWSYRYALEIGYVSHQVTKGRAMVIRRRDNLNDDEEEELDQSSDV